MPDLNSRASLLHDGSIKAAGIKRLIPVHELHQVIGPGVRSAEGRPHGQRKIGGGLDLVALARLSWKGVAPAAIGHLREAGQTKADIKHGVVSHRVVASPILGDDVKRVVTEREGIGRGEHESSAARSRIFRKVDRVWGKGCSCPGGKAEGA